MKERFDGGFQRRVRQFRSEAAEAFPACLGLRAFGSRHVTSIARVNLLAQQYELQ